MTHQAMTNKDSQTKTRQHLPLIWVALHSLLIAAVSVSWLTGMRISQLSRDNWLWLSPLLPQGELHSWHLLSGLLLVFISVGYLTWRLWQKHQGHRSAAKVTEKRKPKLKQRYHSSIQWLGYLLIVTMIGSGLVMAIDLPALKHAPVLIDIHFYSAIALVLYLPLHGGIYFIEYGKAVFKRIFITSRSGLKRQLMAVAVMMIIWGISYQAFWQDFHNTLTVQNIALEEIIEIDGLANEPQWQALSPANIHSFGGANFTDGQTEIRVKALSNGHEMFFHIEWDDPSQSLAHLPLLKSESGWRIQTDGFYRFDERQHYEDKFAIITSKDCSAGAAATAHMGPKPLADKPRNWHGKGYHYRKDQNSMPVDLWHWKAVRTNAMMQMDDNHIATPYPARAGSRRYTAGYTADGKESGAYVMNWDWYKPTVITPKRLPKDSTWLATYQQSSKDNTGNSYVMPWFGSTPYKAEEDHYPVGTVMPSVLYRSNQFEGDRGDIRAHGTWKDGVWSLELARSLKAHSKHDVSLENNVCLWFAAFDHSQIAHTRHSRPLALKFLEQPL